MLGQGNARARKCPPALYGIMCPEMPTARFSENGHCPLMPVPEKNARAAHGHLWACHMKVNLCWIHRKVRLANRQFDQEGSIIMVEWTLKCILEPWKTCVRHGSVFFFRLPRNAHILSLSIAQKCPMPAMLMPVPHLWKVGIARKCPCPIFSDVALPVPARPPFLLPVPTLVCLTSFSTCIKICSIVNQYI